MTMNDRQPGLFDSKIEAAARDAALNLIEVTRTNLVSMGKTIAEAICKEKGRVTSVEVMAVLYQQATTDGVLEEALMGADPRWLGAVFRAGTGWKRVGWEPNGSHKRPVAVWTR